MTLSAAKQEQLRDIANKIRIHSIASTSAAGSGHPTSSTSMAEMLAVLFFDTMRYDVSFPLHPASDRLVLSKGHGCPALYAAWVEAGLISVAELMKLRTMGSCIEGHPTPRLNFIDVATGSLGQGLGVAAGMAYCGKYWDKAPYKVFCIMGDSESAEGSVWEAMAFASFYKLDNLVAIFDINRLGQSDPTMLGHDMETYKARVEAFGWSSAVVDGHDVAALSEAVSAGGAGKPIAILARTLKGKGIPSIENELNWHGKPLGAKTEEAISHLTSLLKTPGPHGVTPKNIGVKVPDVSLANLKFKDALTFKLGDKIATRAAYGTGLLRLGAATDRLVVCDAEVKNSTMTLAYKNKYPERFVECFIAEQNMVSVGVGAACRDRTVVFCSTFAAFFARAYDQIRMAAISFSNVNLCGSHAGCSIGPDGPSQMALEDLAMMRAIPTATVFYPSEAVSCERAVELAANTKGICYIRSTRAATAVLYGNDEEFRVGQGKVVRSSAKPSALLIGAGVTLFECLTAADKLKAEGVEVTVIDPFTIKPLDEKLIREHAEKAGGRVLVNEDHYAQGGLGEAVLAALNGVCGVKMSHLCVREMPHSGPDDVMLARYGIDSGAVVKAVKDLIAC